MRLYTNQLSSKIDHGAKMSRLQDVWSSHQKLLISHSKKKAKWTTPFLFSSWFQNSVKSIIVFDIGIKLKLSPLDLKLSDHTRSRRPTSSPASSSTSTPRSSSTSIKYSMDSSKITSKSKILVQFYLYSSKRETTSSIICYF